MLDTRAPFKHNRGLSPIPSPVVRLLRLGPRRFGSTGTSVSSEDLNLEDFNLCMALSPALLPPVSHPRRVLRRGTVLTP